MVFYYRGMPIRLLLDIYDPGDMEVELMVVVEQKKEEEEEEEEEERITQNKHVAETAII